FDDLDNQFLARQDDRFHRVGQIVYVQHFNLLQLTNFVQIEIVRHDDPINFFRKLHELAVDFLSIVKIALVNFDVCIHFYLDPIQDVKSASPPVSLQHVGGVGDVLQFFQYEARDDDRSFQKFRLANIGDAPVDDNAHIQNFRFCVQNYFIVVLLLFTFLFARFGKQIHKFFSSSKTDLEP